MRPGHRSSGGHPRGLLGEPSAPARASRIDLAAGLARAWKGWLAVGALVILGWIALAVGANIPPDPRLAPVGESSSGAVGEAQMTSVAVGKECLQVEVADTRAERQNGLRGRAQLGPLDGMLFVNDAPVSDAYTMSGVRFPLTIGFFDAVGRLVDRHDAEPCPGTIAECVRYEPVSPYLKVLEVARGDLPSGSLGECLVTLPVTPPG